MQYFQFEGDGNMFIFAPGAGCTGKAKLVSPGNELIFSSDHSEFDINETDVKDEGVIHSDFSASSHVSRYSFYVHNILFSLLFICLSDYIVGNVYFCY